MTVAVDCSANDGRRIGKMLYDGLEALVDARSCSGWRARIGDIGFLDERWEALWLVG